MSSFSSFSADFSLPGMYSREVRTKENVELYSNFNELCMQSYCNSSTPERSQEGGGPAAQTDVRGRFPFIILTVQLSTFHWLVALNRLILAFLSS